MISGFLRHIVIFSVVVNFVLFSGALAVAPAAFSQSPNEGDFREGEYRGVTNRLDQMDNQIQTLSQAVFKSGILPNKSPEDYKSKNVQLNNTPNNPSGDLEVRLSQLERGIRALTGRIETQAHKISKIEEKMERRISDLEMRVQNLEGGDGQVRQTPPAYNAPGTNTAQSGGRQNGGAPVDTLSPGQSSGMGDSQQGQTLGTLSGRDSTRALPIDEYETAFSKLKDGQYEEAEKAFRSFISENPEHRLVSNARYWLGETFYVREDFEQAARAFARGYKENPSGAKAPDNLLKLGLALDGLGNRDDACVALIQLTQKFQDGPRPVLNRASQEIERLDCSR